MEKDRDGQSDNSTRQEEADPRTWGGGRWGPRTVLGVHCGADLLPGSVDREEVAGGVLGPRAVRWGRVLVSMCCGEGTSVAGVGNGGAPSTRLGEPRASLGCSCKVDVSRGWLLAVPPWSWGHQSLVLRAPPDPCPPVEPTYAHLQPMAGPHLGSHPLATRCPGPP